MDAVKNTILRILGKFDSQGFNIINNGKGAGGQIIPHVHFHIVPRKKGDDFGWGNLKEKCKKIKGK